MSTPTNPFERFEELFERMATQFEETARAFEGDETGSRLPSVGPRSVGRTMLGTESMAVDLVERDDEYVATVDLPGFSRDDVEVRVTDDALHVEAHHEEEREMSEMDEMGDESEASEMGEATYLRRERSHRTMERSIRLPEPVDADGTEAHFENGVLTVTVPRAEPLSSAKQIDIEGE